MTKEFTVGDISCGHCAQAITKEVTSVPGVQNVKVDLGTKRVSVEANEQVTTDTLVNAINEAGYADITVLN
ncbi:MAG: heavy-metal-associated domain-containing protein [Chloroflexota bacterium]|nr:heavy-metal-associated domain-containing protein [Chloroflexota bacterium]